MPCVISDYSRTCRQSCTRVKHVKTLPVLGRTLSHLRQPALLQVMLPASTRDPHLVNCGTLSWNVEKSRSHEISRCLMTTA